MNFLAKVSPIRLVRRAFTRMLNVESIPTFDRYEHASNMRTKDLFQFEPFNDNELVVGDESPVFTCRTFRAKRRERTMI